MVVGQGRQQKGQYLWQYEGPFWTSTDNLGTCWTWERNIVFVNMYNFALKPLSELETMPSTLTNKTAIFSYLIWYYSTPLKQTIDNCQLEHLKPKFNHDYLSGYSCLLPIPVYSPYSLHRFLLNTYLGSALSSTLHLFQAPWTRTLSFLSLKKPSLLCCSIGASILPYRWSHP